MGRFVAKWLKHVAMCHYTSLMPEATQRTEYNLCLTLWGSELEGREKSTSFAKLFERRRCDAYREEELMCICGVMQIQDVNLKERKRERCCASGQFNDGDGILGLVWLRQPQHYILYDSASSFPVPSPYTSIHVPSWQSACKQIVDVSLLSMRAYMLLNSHKARHMSTLCWQSNLSFTNEPASIYIECARAHCNGQCLTVSAWMRLKSTSCRAEYTDKHTHTQVCIYVYEAPKYNERASPSSPTDIIRCGLEVTVRWWWDGNRLRIVIDAAKCPLRATSNPSQIISTDIKLSFRRSATNGFK